MKYVIKRSDGAYAAPPGQRSSYTPYLQRARTWFTREAAEDECCPGNERVASVDEELNPEAPRFQRRREL